MRLNVLESWGSLFLAKIHLPLSSTSTFQPTQINTSLDSQLVQQQKIMPPPSALSIKTSSVIRLIKEEASYHKEAVAQEKVIEKLEKEGGDEYELRQQVRLPR